MAYPDLIHIKININKSLIDDDVSTSYESESMCFSRVNSKETLYTDCFSNDYIKNNEFIKCKSDESKKKIIYDHDNKCDMYSLLSGLPCTPKYRFPFCPWNLKKNDNY